MAAVLYACSDTAPPASGARYKVADKWPFSPANVKRLQRGLCVALPPKSDTGYARENKIDDVSAELRYGVVSTTSEPREHGRDDAVP